MPSGSVSVTSEIRPRGWFWCENAIFDLPVSIYARITLMYLKRCADSDGASFPKIITIAKAIGASRRRVEMALRELITVKALSVESGAERGRVNHYTLHSVGYASDAQEYARGAQGVVTTCAPPTHEMRTEGILREGIPIEGQRSTTLSGTPDVLNGPVRFNHHSAALEVLTFLNHKTGRQYQPVRANLDLIEARLREGATVNQCRAIIGLKTRAWNGDEKMAPYLRPATLFNRSKFAQYQGELPATAFEEDHPGA